MNIGSTEGFRRRSAWLAVALLTLVAPLLLLMVATASSVPAARKLAAVLATDEVHISNLTDEDDAELLVDGRIDGECRNDALYIAEATVELGDVTASTSEDCGTPEVAVFSRRHAFALKPKTWSVNADPVNVTLANRITVDLNAWVTASHKKALTWALGDITRAISLYDENRVGITFTAPSPLPVLDGTNPSDVTKIASIGSDCAAAEALANAKTPSELYDEKKVNVYFVQTLADNDRGISCNSANAIYVSIGAHTPTTLAHELGHILGLRGDNQGHTNGMDPLTENNIMWSGQRTSAQANKRKRFSLGQVYRMNVHEESWINPPPSASTPARPGIRNDVTKKCQASEEEQTPCPPVTVRP